jgi:polysaccharide biosynthesis protein PslH
MNILFITSRIPFPPFRGDKVRTFRILKALHDYGHEITLVSFVSSNNETKYQNNLQQYCKQIILVKLTPFKSIINCIFGIRSLLPFQILFFRSLLMKKTIDSLLKTETFDLVHIHLIRMVEYVKDYKDIIRVIDLTDAGSLYLTRFLEYEKLGIKKILLSIELKRLRAYEVNIRYFQNNLVCSEKDKNVLLCAVPDATISIINNGIDLTQIKESYVYSANNKRIIFTGNLTYFPNIDAIKYFVKEIFPMVLENEPDSMFYIVGQNPPRAIRKLMSKNIIVTGFVGDIIREYLKSSIAVAPIRFGAGSQFKILEALAIGLPVVTTSIAAEGINSVNGEEVLTANNPKEFATAILQLFHDSGLRNKLSSMGKEMIRKKYSMEVVGRELNELYSKIAYKPTK